MRRNPADPRKRRAERSKDPVDLDRVLAQTGQRSRYYAEQLLVGLWRNAHDHPELPEETHEPLVGEILAGSPLGGGATAAPGHEFVINVPGPFGRPNGYKLSISVMNYSTAVPFIRRRDRERSEVKSTAVRIGLALRSPREGLDVNPIYWFLGNRARWDLTFEDHVKRKIPPRFWYESLNFDLMRAWDQALDEVTAALEENYVTMGHRIGSAEQLLAKTAQGAGSLDSDAVWAYVRGQQVQQLDRFAQSLMTIPGPTIGRRVIPHTGKGVWVDAWNASGDGICEAAVTCLARYLQRFHKAVILRLGGADAYNTESGWFASASIELTSTRAKKTRNPLKIRVIWDRMNGAWRSRDNWAGNELPPGGVWTINAVHSPGTVSDLGEFAKKWIEAEFPDSLVSQAWDWHPGTTRPLYYPTPPVGDW